MKLRLVAVPFIFAALGCNQPSDYCTRVMCDPGWTCQPSTGVCLAPDAGIDDGGMVDAGMGCSPACPTGKLCNAADGMCVDCLSDSSCACPTPTCGSAHTCVAPDPDAGVTQLLGESCLTPANLVFPNCGNVAEFHVDTSVLADDETGSCSAPMSLGKDAVYTLTLAEEKDVTITAVGVGSSQPLIYLRSNACEAGSSELGCSDGANMNTANLHVKSLPKGTYWLVIDSYYAASAGGVDVTVLLDPPTLPANEACGTAAPLDLDGGVTVVDLIPAEDDDQGSCNTNPDAPEVVYVATLTQPADLLLSAIPVTDADGGTVNDAGLALIYVRTSPCLTGEEKVCAAPTSGEPTLRMRALPAGNYYVFVEAVDRASASWVKVSATATGASPPPPNDTCLAPRLITFPTGMNSVEITVDTSQASDDYTGSCNTQPNSPEVVYQLHLSAFSHVEVTTRPAPGSFADPVLYLRTTPCNFPAFEMTDPDSGMMIGDSGIELGCDHEPPPTPEDLVGDLDPGDYFIYVEGYGLTGAGPTTLTVTVN